MIIDSGWEATLYLEDNTDQFEYDYLVIDPAFISVCRCEDNVYSPLETFCYDLEEGDIDILTIDRKYIGSLKKRVRYVI